MEMGKPFMRDNTAKEEEQQEDLVSLCGSVATTAGEPSMSDFGLEEGALAVASDRDFECKFFVMKDEFFPGKIFAFPHPASRERALYLLNERGEVFELLKFDNGKRSFFCGDSVVGNGSVHMFFPVHPLFLAIDHLQRKTFECFLSVSELLEDDDFPALSALSQSAKLIDALKIAADFEFSTKSDCIRFRHNEQRLLNWLEERFHILKNSFAAKSDENENCADDEHCFGILADYMPESVAQRLKERLNIKNDRPKAETQKKKRAWAESLNEKGAKGGRTVKRKHTNITNKGSPSIASFFGTAPNLTNK